MSNDPLSRRELKLSFMSANFVARPGGYSRVKTFGEGSKAAEQHLAPAATYAERIDEICAEIAAMGFDAFDLWTSLCSPNWATRQHLDGLLAALARHNLKVISLAGGMGRTLEDFDKLCQLARDVDCRLLGVGGHLDSDNIDDVARILDKWDVELAFENHPG